MNRNKVLAVLTTVAVASSLLVLITNTVDSLAQNDTSGLGNQSSGAVNDTSMVNATGSGGIAGWVPRGP